MRRKKRKVWFSVFVEEGKKHVKEEEGIFFSVLVKAVFIYGWGLFFYGRTLFGVVIFLYLGER